ncbi:MAG: MFS transporter [Burkholderiales bacterium]|nr:MFS transporter [Burkholderiales bacterium]
MSGFVQLRAGESRALGWSFAYFFFLLAGYYVLRPLRDEMGVAGGVRNLQWLFTATFLAMLVAVPVYGALVARWRRSVFIPAVYHFFAANLAIFWALLVLDIERVTLARVFFVWVSVFNLFAVSVFWSFMADSFTSEQGKRLFGFIAAGGSLGALAGPALTVWLVGILGPVKLLLVAAVFLELAVLCAARLAAAGTRPAATGGASDGGGAARSEKEIGGGALQGLVLLARSPYLAGIAAWVFLLSLAGTFLYFQQANLVAAASDDPAVRTRLFASIDLGVGILTVAVQFLATGRLISKFGVGPAAAFLPGVFAAGFAVLAMWQSVWMVLAFQALQRAGNFALSNPAREILFTVVHRDEKYKAKNVIDTVVFRGSDAVTGWLFSLLQSGWGLSLGAISFATVPVALAWLALSLWLGRVQESKAQGT